MSDPGNQITGMLVTIIAYTAWMQVQVPGASDYLMQGISKGEMYIFALLLCFILLWSFVQAATFVLDLIAALVTWLHKILITENAETRERIEIAGKKLREVIRVLRT